LSTWLGTPSSTPTPWSKLWEAGSIGGAALDVTDPEPLPEGHPLWTEPPVLITPHAANPPDALTRRLAECVEENVARYASREDLASVIDVEAGY
jgi:D-3-phosphoglycerate dehydrogenase